LKADFFATRSNDQRIRLARPTMSKLSNVYAAGALILNGISVSAGAQVLQPPTNLRVESIAGCTGVVSGNTCYPAPPATAAAGKQWQLAYQEEFDGSNLNTAKLTPCPDWGCSGSFNTGRERYAASQVKVSDGTAKLIAAPASTPQTNTGCYQGVCDYVAGLVSTARPRPDSTVDYLYAFTYGYVEARLKVPASRGIFTAFWMLPASTNYTYNEEIDILEMLGGNTDTAFMTYHYGGRAQSYAVNRGDNNNGACAVKDYSSGFSTFGVEWQPNYVAWYINGVKCGQYTGTTSTSKMYLILNLMVDNQWQRDWNLATQNNPTDQLEVDYIRVYQQR
jgi:beta-glucanase (GH16 family)